MCRAARVGLGWSRNQLAREAGIGERTLIDFERGARDPHGNNKLALRKALQRGRVQLTDDGCICYRSRVTPTVALPARPEPN